MSQFLRVKLRPGRKSKVKMLYSPKDLTEAYRMVKDKALSVRQACTLYGVPRSTLRDRLENRVSIECTRTGPETFFTEEEERRLCKHLKAQAEMRRDLTRADVTRLATDFAVHLQKRSSDRRLSLHWFYSFMSRWPELKVIMTGAKNSEPETISDPSGEDDSVSENAVNGEPDSVYRSSRGNDTGSENAINDEPDTVDSSSEKNEILTKCEIDFFADRSTVVCKKSIKHCSHVSSMSGGKTLEDETEILKKCTAQSSKKAKQLKSRPSKQQIKGKGETLMSLKQCKADTAKKRKTNSSKPKKGQKRYKEGTDVETYDDCITHNSKKVKLNRSKVKMLYSSTDMAEAYRMVKDKELSLSQACALYGVPRSTLRDRLEHRVSIECTRTGPEAVFTEEKKAKPNACKVKMLYSTSDMAEAYRMVKDKELNLSQACAVYGVPRSTLRDRLENRVSIECTRTGPETVFTEEEERRLCEHLKSHAEIRQQDLTRADVTRLATDFAVHLQKRSSDRRLSLQWFYSFMSRWPELKVIMTGAKKSEPESVSGPHSNR